MKNIHVLPTDKPTWLHKSLLSNVLIKSSACIDDMKQAQGMNIYITSAEEIKEGDWFVKTHNIRSGVFDEVFKSLSSSFIGKKIILTTDHDLIKDGVQAIDDEFLEWFVKNPSCESVKFNTYPIGLNGNIIGTDRLYPFDGLISNFRIDYKIIIPQEKAKQDTVGKKFYESADKVITVKRQEKKPHSFCETPEEQCTMNYCDENGCQNRVRHLVESKQEIEEYTSQDFLNEVCWNKPKEETLEEAAEKYAEGKSSNFTFRTTHIRDFSAGAKWQQEQDKKMYSEKEVLEILNDCRGENPIDIDKWFEQFKKK
jgi:hypothetical protein